MGWIQKIFKRSAGVVKHYCEIPIFGGTDAGVSVTEDKAVGQATVWSALNVLSNAVCGLPCNVYKRTDQGREKDTKHRVYRLIAKEPNANMTAVSFWTAIMVNAAISGNAYAVIKWSQGQPIGLIPVPSRYVQIVYDNEVSGEHAYRIRLPNGTNQIYPQSEVCHFVWMSFNGIEGMSPVEYHRQCMGLAIGAEKYAALFFGKAAHGSGYLETPEKLEDIEKAALRAAFETRNSGMENAHRVIVLENGLKYSPSTIPMDQAQFLQTRKFQAEQLSAIFGVPGYKMNIEGKTASYASRESSELDFLTNTIRPWCIRFEQEICRKMFREDEKETYYAEFLIDAILRADADTRKNYYQTMLQWGVWNRNEVREKDNLNAIPGGDVYLVPLNMAPLGETGAPAVPDRPPDEPGAAIEAEKPQESAEQAAKPTPDPETPESDRDNGKALALGMAVRALVDSILSKETKAVDSAIRRNRSLSDYYERHREFVANRIALAVPSIDAKAFAETYCARQLAELEGAVSDKCVGDLFFTWKTARAEEIAQELIAGGINANT